MPLVTIRSKAAWGGGNALETAREKALVNGIGERVPQWMLDAMAGTWPEEVLDEIMVVFEPLGNDTINGPDIWVEIKFGKKWHALHSHATTYLALTVNEWVSTQISPRGRSVIQRPAIDIEVVLVDWHGASLDREGRIKNEW